MRRPTVSRVLPWYEKAMKQFGKIFAVVRGVHVVDQMERQPNAETVFYNLTDWSLYSNLVGIDGKVGILHIFWPIGKYRPMVGFSNQVGLS